MNVQGQEQEPTIVGEDPVFRAPEYMAMRARAAEAENEPDPLPELGRQGRTSGGSADELEQSSDTGGVNAAVLRLLCSQPTTAPDLTRYPAAVTTQAGSVRTFLVPVGQVVVFNVHASVDILPSRPYLKTVKGRVTAVDPETGLVSVHDVDRKQQCCLDFHRHDPAQVRWPGRKIWEAQRALLDRALPLLETGDADDSVEALRLLQQAKSMEGRGESAGTGVVAQRRVGRPRRVRTEAELERQRLHEERKARGEVRRGRPRGSKNRPTEEIEAEKRRSREERRARKEARRRKK